MLPISPADLHSLYHPCRKLTNKAAAATHLTSTARAAHCR